MKAQLTTINDHGVIYDALKFVCPGCKDIRGTGLHMLPVNCSDRHSPSWDWDGNLEAPTVSPSILTHGVDSVCHSFLRNGVFEYLGDSTHRFSGQFVPMDDLEDWMIKE